MKILLVNTVPTDKNGVTMVIFNYLREMNTKGMSIDLLSINEPNNIYVKEIEQKGGQVHVLQRSGSKIMSYWNNLRRLVKQNKYDVVHVHGNSHTVVLELSAVWMAGCKIRMVHSHNTTCTFTGIHKLMSLPFYMLYTHGLACGIDAGRWMFGKHQFDVINNGINTEVFSFNKETRVRVRKKYGWDNCKVIGHVGSFIPVKNQKFIVDVFYELYSRDTTYRLLLIGDGDLLNDVKHKVDALGLRDVVTFTGNVENVSEYLNAIDLVVMPSLFEGLPLSLIEQQANGLQCVISDTITSEADKTGNLLFVSLCDNVKIWADKIQLLEFGDRELRSHLAVKSIIESGYSIQAEAKKLKEFYFTSQSVHNHKN